MADQQNKISGEIEERLNLSRKVTPSPANDFDNSDRVPALSTQTLMQIQSAGLLKDVLLTSPLNVWCEVNKKSKEHEFISPAHLEALRQYNYNAVICTHVVSSSGGDSPDGTALMLYTPFKLCPDEDQSCILQQRYHKEFIEKECIGKGGFGMVYKAQHRLDKEYYAVKKIEATKKKSFCFHSMQREIQALARLNHPNIVRYYQSWFGEEFQKVSEENQNELMWSIRSTDDTEEEDDDGTDDSNDSDDDCDEEDHKIEINGEDVKRWGHAKHVPTCTSPIIREVVGTKTEHCLQEVGISAIIPLTSEAAAILSTVTSPLASSTHVQNKTQYTLSCSQRRFQKSNFSRSRSWNGQESSAEVNTSYQLLPRPPFKRYRYLYIQMELCYSTLRRWLEDRRDTVATTRKSQFDVVDERQNQNIYKQILEGMEYIHSKKILHRDMTPKNIFLSRKEGDQLLVKIGDFGLAREEILMEPKFPMRFQQDQNLQECTVDPCTSQTYTPDIGTKPYAAPEQLDGTTYNNKSDMYSLGLILFELYHPFGTDMERYKCLENLRNEGSIPEELGERWPAQYSAIQRLTSEESQKRPSASDILDDMFPSRNEIIESQADEIEKLKKLLAVRDAENSHLKKLLKERDAKISKLKQSRSHKT